MCWSLELPQRHSPNLILRFITSPNNGGYEQEGSRKKCKSKMQMVDQQRPNPSLELSGCSASDWHLERQFIDVGVVLEGQIVCIQRFQWGQLSGNIAGETCFAKFERCNQGRCRSMNGAPWKLPLCRPFLWMGGSFLLTVWIFFAYS